jgi:predicted P-loop ATPase
MGNEQFLKNDFFISDYLELHQNIDKAVERNDEATKQVYGFVHKMNQAGRKYTDEDIRMQCEMHYLNFDKCKKIFERVFNDHKDDFDIDNKPSIFKITSYIKKNYSLERNIVSSKLENNGGDFKIQDLSIDLLEKGFKFPKDHLKDLLESKHIPEYDPFQRCFDNLPKWDGVDYLKKLCSYFDTDDNDFFEIMLKKMLVRSIRCGLSQQENRFIMVLCGKNQEIGKSSFIRWLNPMTDEYYVEGIKKDDKDMNLALAKNFFINLDELNQVSNVDLSRVKEMISMKSINERQAYRADSESMKRRCNFFGTSNKDDFLIDSANSRWLVFNVNDIDYHAYLKSVPKDLLWAQMYYLYKSDMFDPELTKEERAIREARNKSFRNESIEYQLISKYFIAGRTFMSTSDIVEFLQGESPIKLNTRYISQEMEKIGIPKIRMQINGIHQRGYMLKHFKGTPKPIN